MSMSKEKLLFLNAICVGFVFSSFAVALGWPDSRLSVVISMVAMVVAFILVATNFAYFLKSAFGEEKNSGSAGDGDQE